MASTPDLAGDKEGFGHSSSQRGINQFPSSNLLYQTPATRNKESFTASGLGAGGRQSKQKRSCMPTDKKKRRWVFIGVPVVLVIIAAIIVGVLVGIDQKNKPKSGSSSSTGSGAGTGGGTAKPTSTGIPGLDNTSNNPYITTSSGQTGGKAVTDLGVEFDFANSYNGDWAQNAESPYSVSTFVMSLARVMLICRYPVELKTSRPACWKNGSGARTLREGTCISPLIRTNTR